MAAQGFIYRDLKPSNVLSSSDDTGMRHFFITDFELACSVAERARTMTWRVGNATGFRHTSSRAICALTPVLPVCLATSMRHMLNHHAARGGSSRTN